VGIYSDVGTYTCQGAFNHHSLEQMMIAAMMVILIRFT
jgi:hypothetical protein